MHFKGSPGCCELHHSGIHLDDVPMINNLCQLNVMFLPPSSSLLVGELLDLSPFVAFVPSQRSWDLWHAHFGHLSGELAKALSSVMTGIGVDMSSPQTRCDSCIITKHPHQPFIPSPSPPAGHLLELVHSNICSPFSTTTLHGKHYFILFLDGHSHVLNVQLLATWDQAFEAWKIVQA